MIVNIFEARNKLSALIRAASSGETVVIANRGKPVARLVPVEDHPVGGTGEVAGIVKWFEENRLPAHMGRSVDEIDAYIEAERASWD